MVNMRELLCQLCHKEYPIWYAPNDIWNSVMRDKGGREETPFVCPTCFGKEYEKRYGTCIWEFKVNYIQNTTKDNRAETVQEFLNRKGAELEKEAREARPRGTLIRRKCKWCKEDIFPREADVKRGRGLYCNKSCKAKYQTYRGHTLVIEDYTNNEVGQD